MKLMHYHQRQKSNSAAASSIDDNPAVAGRAGFTIVVDQFHCRAIAAVGALNAQVLGTVTDGTQSSIVVAGSSTGPSATGPPSSNAYAHGKMEGGPHKFGEGKDVRVIVAGNSDASTVGYSMDYHFEPIFSGFTGAQP